MIKIPKAASPTSSVQRSFAIMIEELTGFHQHISLTADKLLREGEIIVVVDDDQSISGPLSLYFQGEGLQSENCNTAENFLQILNNRKVALALLDIGLPDGDGISLISKIVEKDPDVAIIMLTGVADLQVALDCIRRGADDFLSKPAKFKEILFTVKKTLEKRRLIFENRKYQEDLENAHFRIQLMHQLSLKMNTVYLGTVELDQILRAILVGITANEGLRFNRAFLAMFDEEQKRLEGRLAIGTTCRERAAEIWASLRKKEMDFLDIVENLKSCANEDSDVNNIAKMLRIPVSDRDNILIKAAFERRSIRVSEENGCKPILLDRRKVFLREEYEDPQHDGERRKNGTSDPPLPVPHELIELLGETSFVVVPLFSPGRSFGVIIADNFVTRATIMSSHVNALELFASQASLAIEHTHLYLEKEKKIKELEEVNQELEKSKDLLVAAERYSALGLMAAQMVHVIRNPITSIGGVARILAKKVQNEEWQRYLGVMIKETARLESTLEDLFDFVTQEEAHKEPVLFYNILRKTLMLVQANLVRQNIAVDMDLQEPNPVVTADERQIRQMLLHLLKNAIEAMPEGGTLTIKSTLGDQRIHVSIRDTGIGILASNLDRAKDSFFTTKTYGTGMGLTMVDRIVTSHNGTFELIPHEIGLEVVVHLPIQ